MADKKCSKCAEVKALNEFGVQNRRGQTKPQSACKVCRCAAGVGFYLQTRGRQRALQKAAYEENRDRRLQAMRAYHRMNSGAVMARKAEYYEVNKPLFLASNAKRRAAEILAATCWDAELDALVFAEAYRLAQRRADLIGGDWHVDHVVPLRGRQVCGLHSAYNIEVVPARYNLQKSNKFPSAETDTRSWL